MFKSKHLTPFLFPLGDAGSRQRVSFHLPGTVWIKVLLFLLWNSSLTVSAFATCTAPRNPIEAENCLPGNPSSQWFVIGTGSPSIQGFATDISVNVGQTVFFKIATNSSLFHIDIYRIGYYQGNGARLVASILPSAMLPQAQPPCLTDSSTRLTDCGNWAISASWTVPDTATSGVYFARLVRLDTGEASPVIFIVRNDSSHSDILVQTSDPTWHAYNDYGGSSLYTGAPIAAYKVSYNRPFNVPNMYTWFFSAEYPFVRWIEANGYDVSYFTGVDTDRNGRLIPQHKIFMSVGHDEYWSGGQRGNVEAARAAGVNLAFFSGNEIFWKTRWESSIDGTNTPYRTLVCYKETQQNRVIDPADPPIWTGWWRDPRFSPPADGGRPENALSGTIFWVNGIRNDPITVPQADGKMRFWRNTSIASLAAGQVATLPAGTLGYEWDVDADNGFRPAGLVPLSTTTLTVSIYLLDYNTFGNSTATHHLTLYRAPSGALVFGAGTVQWSWGLDGDHAIAGTPTDPNMQQATVNLLADMGVQPATLQVGLLPATLSTDTAPPRSTITSPASGSAVTAGSTVTISGAAVDFGGGVAGSVEVSVDRGKTWHPALGRESWNYTFTSGNTGNLSIQSRAVDDSGNLEVPSPGISLVVLSNPGGNPLSVSTTSLPDASQSVAYIQNLAAVGGTAPYGWTLLSGTLPAGLALSSSGQISGTPTSVGASSFTVQVTDSSSPVQTAARTLSITVFGSPGSQTISVSIAPAKASLLVGSPQQFTAKVTNDPANSGVTWTVAAASGTNCSGAACGTVSPTSTASGTSAIYTSPAIAPTGGTVTVSATSVTNNTQSASATVTVTPGVNNNKLNGSYAFTFNGITGNPGGSVVYAAVGRFTADGAGSLTNGELDTNGIGPGAVLTAQPFTGTYAIGADNRGLMTLNIAGRATKLPFVMIANGNAKFTVFDAAGGTGTVGSGAMEKVDTTAYDTAQITGDYAFGAAGLDNSNNRTALAGRFTSNGAGILTNGAGDINASGTVSSVTFTSANYTVSDTASGRGTINLAVSVGGVPRSFNYVFYVVNAGKLFAMEMDVVTSLTPLLNGVVLRQQTPTGGFSNATLNAGMVVYLTGLSVCGSGTGAAPNVLAGLLNADGNGALTLTFDENCGGTPNSGTGLFGTYSVAGNGRTSITVGNGEVGYLVSLNQAFLFSTDSSVLFGFGEPQTVGASTNSAVNGTYAGMTSTPTTFGVVVFSGEFTGDGAGPTGTITGTEDIGAPSGPNSGVAFKATYSVSSSPTNGRGTATVTSGGSGGNAVVYVVSTSKFVTVPLSDPNPAIWSFEQSSPVPTLSSLTLDPTSVIGGNPSAGTVTLSGPAPSSSALISLSSSNLGAATVPSSVTVPAGANSTTFVVSTSAVAASTPVTISASYGGVTQSASLTVTPAPNYSLSASPSSLSIAQGTSGTSTITVTSQNGFRGSVSLSASGLPSGVTASFSPNPAPATSTLTLAASSTATTGTVTVTITGTSGSLTHRTSIALTVTAAPNYTLSASPNSLSVTQGTSGTSSITVTPQNGFRGSVSLSASGLPSGVTASFSPNPVTATSMLTVTASSTATTGTVTVAITGTSASLKHTTTITLTVLPTLSSLTLNPTSVIGGVQSSTGTVTLSGPAPAGGAQVLLSSSNTGVVRVPSSVTVPAGATSATFTVSTSLVLVSTSVTISASYNNTAQTASLTLLL